MYFRWGLLICELCLLLIVVSGCETIKGVTKGGAQGLSKDYQNTKNNIKQAYEYTRQATKKTDDWIRKNLW